MICEFFDKGVWKHRADAKDQSIEYDYMYQTKVAIPVPVNVNVRGMVCVLLDQKNNQKYLGVVTEQSETDFVITSLLRHIDFDILPKVLTANIEQTMANEITSQYITNPDTLQTIPNLQVVAETTTSGNINIPNIVKFSDTLIVSLKRYQIVVLPTMDLNSGIITLHIKKITSPTIHIKYDVINKLTLISEQTAMLNKISYYNIDNDLLDNYYLYDDNTVGTLETDTRRIEPVIAQKKIVDETQNGFNLIDLANQDLQGGIYKNEIQLTLYMSNKTINHEQLIIGTKIVIHGKYENYLSLITGINFDTQQELIHIKCGLIRKNLSNKLKQGGIK